MKKLKPLLPTLKERKRYLAYEIISEHRISNFNDISTSFWDSIIENMGSIGAADAGIMLLDDTYKSDIQKGLIRVGHKKVDDLRYSLMNITEIAGHDSIVRSVGISGILKKAKDKYLEG